MGGTRVVLVVLVTVCVLVTAFVESTTSPPNCPAYEQRLNGLTLMVADLRSKTKRMRRIISELQSEISQTKERLNQNLPDVTKRVAFHAVNVVSHPVDGQAYVFPTVLYNQGRAYNSSTGVFTAPVGGVYVFLVTTKALLHGGANVHLIVDRTIVGRIDSSTPGASSACSAVLPVPAGQTAWVQGWRGEQVGNTGTAFSGFLLYPDDA